ncbi:3-dehydroquinate synthase [SAR202 cluster bacterium AD-804-J14_MRT_500m]|nr:3-dehydroquinate synthase [SAR202 cluster bacterium AD-804-J14_MRT_500m]
MTIKTGRYIILTGFSGTGKSVIGFKVADFLGWEFIDTDLEIVRKTGKDINAIFKEDGETVFRRLEREVLSKAFNGANRVIATGGGVMVDPANRSKVLQEGLVVCLEATPEIICRRLDVDHSSQNPEIRPLLSDSDGLDQIRILKSSRQSCYGHSHWTVQTDLLSEDQVTSEVLRAWNLLQPKIYATLSTDPLLATTVSHSSGKYPILVGWGILEQLGDRLTESGIDGPVFVVTDSNVFPIYGRQAQRALQRSGIEAHFYVIPPGEESKTLSMASEIYQFLVHRRAERRNTIIAIGGGVVGDLAGFVAATFLRGLKFIQVPTSMAAMVDASIGGKTAVNLPQAKNMIGAFYQPQMVLADIKTLTTLGKRELSEGWAEAIKHGFILDADLVTIFEQNAEQLMNLDRDISAEVIRRSMMIKAEVVSHDERETLGRRILLNYGHTIGHALEASTSYDTYMHGEGVSVGMMGAAEISRRMGLIGADDVSRQRDLLARFNLPVRPTDMDIETLVSAMSLDKKTVGGTVRWVLLDKIGQAISSRDVPPKIVHDVLQNLATGG